VRGELSRLQGRVGERRVVPLTTMTLQFHATKLRFCGAVDCAFDHHLFQLQWGRGSCSHGQDEGKDDPVKLLHRGKGGVRLGS
jgi:hypothetical protein